MCIKPNTATRDLPDGTVQRFKVRCRNCWACRKERVDDYVGRCLAEAETSEWLRTFTLTYRDDEKGELIRPSDHQRFIRAIRIRTKNNNTKIRYFGVGEYGERKGRAHFHTILFGKGKAPHWPIKKNNSHISEWPHGMVWIDKNASARAIRYTAKYLLKGKTKDDRWFTLSKKPPLGDEWFTKKALLHCRKMSLPQSFEYTPPGDHSNNRKFLMTGATRRNFLLTIFDNWPVGGWYEEHLNEFVQSALEKANEDRRQSELLGPDDFQLLRAELDTRRLTELQSERIRNVILLRGLTNCED